MSLPSGVKAQVVDGKLKLFGLKAFEKEEQEKIISWARDNKQAIIENLLRELLHEVGAVIRRDPDGQVLVFEPPLAGSDCDPMRWDSATKLEEVFFTSQQEKEGTHE